MDNQVDGLIPYKPLSIPAVAALQTKGYTNSQIAKLYGVTRQAVSKYIKSHSSTLHGLKNYDDIVEMNLKHVAVQTLSSVDEDDIKKANLRDKMISAGVALSKLSELKGKSAQTNNVLVNVIIQGQQSLDKVITVDKSVDNT